MKTIKELLQIVLDDGNKNFIRGDPYYPHGYYGLCGFVRILNEKKIINDKDHEILQDFIENNDPRDTITRMQKGFFWPAGQWSPRKRWIKNKIKEL